MGEINPDGIVSGCFMLVINGSALLLNIILMINLVINRRSLPPYMWLVFNLTANDIVFAFLGLTIRGPGMMYRDYYTSSVVGEAFCIIFFYAVYPIISVNFNTYILLVLNQFLAIRRPLQFSAKGNSLQMRRTIRCAIAGTWAIAVGYFGIYLVLVYTGVGTTEYDPSFSRCSMTSTEQGKAAHMILQTIFVIVPSFTCLALYIGIVVILARNKKKNRGGVTNHAFVTISILLALFYISHWPSVILRDLPRLFKKKINLPNSLTTSMSVFYYLNGLTDPIIYGYRSNYLFTKAKLQIGLTFSRQESYGKSTNSGKVLSKISTNVNSVDPTQDIALANINTCQDP